MIYETKEKGLVRDSTNRALLNTDVEALKRYKEQRQQIKAVSSIEERMSAVEASVSDIKQDLSNINQLLQLIAAKLNG